MAAAELGLVPEIYYDVIARLCAGVPFVALTLWYYPSLRILPSIALAVAVAFGSYLIGHLLATVSALWNLLLWNPRFLRFVIPKLHLSNPFPTTSFVAAFNEVYKRIDYVANRDSNAGALLKKMEAGAQLSDNLFSGFVVVVVTKWIMGPQPCQMHVVAAILLTAVLLTTVIVRRIILIGRQDMLFSILSSADASATKSGVV
jgi:hypothetical protein